MKYKITAQHHGERLDKFLVRKTHSSRSQIQRLIRLGRVLVNDKRTTKTGFQLHVGDMIAVREIKHDQSKIKGEKIPLDILYEDQYLLIVNKPPGMIVHPGAGVRSGTLANALQHYLASWKGDERAGLVHRLDKDTSGVLIVAKNVKVHERLSCLMEKREIQKTYLALVAGHITPKSGTIDAPITRDRADRKIMRVADIPSARHALTHFRVIEYVKGYSLLEVVIETGRTHQIRVHFKAIGFPVAGDQTYGVEKVNNHLKKLGLKRQFLHAWKLRFKHPVTKKIIDVEASLPEDLEKTLKKLKALSSNP